MLILYVYIETKGNWQVQICLPYYIMYKEHILNKYMRKIRYF